MSENLQNMDAVEHVKQLFPNGGKSLAQASGAPPSGGGAGW